METMRSNCFFNMILVPANVVTQRLQQTESFLFHSFKLRYVNDFPFLTKCAIFHSCWHQEQK